MRLNSKELKKHFYSIPDLAAKWDCDEKDIIHLAISREIFLSINLTQYSLPNISGWWNIHNPGEIATLLAGDDAFYVSFFHNPADDDNPEKFTTLRRYDDATRRAFEFSRSEVFVRGKYVEKFEPNHPEKFLNDHAAELHQPQKDVEQRQNGLSPTREKTLLKMIGALLAMRYRGPDFEKSNGDPNVSRIAESVQQDMASAAIDDYGLKDRTLRELIPKAMEAIAENRG